MSDLTGPDGIEPTSQIIDASAQLARLIGNPSNENLAACKAWFEAADEHRKNFAAVMFATPIPEQLRARVEIALSRKFDAMPGISHAEQASTANEVSVPSQNWGALRLQARISSDPRKRRRQMVGTGVALAASVAIAALGTGLMPNFLGGSVVSPASAQTYETKRAEIRSFSLPDGTELTLDSDTRVQVTVDRDHRHALLRQGRARFVVKPDPRPFTIKSPNGQIVSAQGTVDVDVGNGSSADIRLRAGAASVQTEGREARPLAIDQPLINAPGDTAAAPITTTRADTRDWPTGWVEYRTVSLGALIEQANRYAKLPIVLDDPSLAGLQASGRFKLTDTEKFVSRIAKSFGLKVSRRADGIHLSK